MKLALYSALALGASLTGVAASVCDPNQIPSDIIQNAPLVQQSTTWVSNPNVPITINGNVQVLTGCTFVVHNFTFYGSPPGQVLWYGGSPGSSVAITVSDDQVIQQVGNLDSPVFTLRSQPGSQASFSDFTELRIFAVDPVNQLIATAQIRQVATSTSQQPPAPPSASQSNASGNKTNLIATQPPTSDSGRRPIAVAELLAALALSIVALAH
ncbi:uncharacterized protein BJ171DRAFT_565781 [Polychytrium aggregatum]|uniref:uncharacterized protein n=1 Tax=Polychytrium aggregatum TaxID=110093 RepID=UPI0022FDB3C8|nr:uncharacterized protein BJ171DRAFT_565781 [Polychytrium aggregatum]KAI9207444.1 hypothetical protein BJ171DRAFT_565781 [Polychytrium aggregatum]